ncbi:MAG: DNA gyrase inhibitor YacG [Proteobacteria bacterium]|nr:DNA gyrase inhibitor YacG [Pseudomonadota bacterium]
MLDDLVIKKILCPLCQKKSSLKASNPYRPFCSERCKLIDLGSWGSEQYKIPTTNSEAEREWEENETNKDKDND